MLFAYIHSDERPPEPMLPASIVVRESTSTPARAAQP
jgi:hypothetical protein